MGRISRQTAQKSALSAETGKMQKLFTAEDLARKVAGKGIGIATVYRFLKELRDSGEIHSYVCDRRTVYSHRQMSHCHFVCEKSGKVVHFAVDSLDFLKNKIPGSISSFQIEVRGICDEECAVCSKKK